MRGAGGEGGPGWAAEVGDEAGAGAAGLDDARFGVCVRGDGVFVFVVVDDAVEEVGGVDGAEEGGEGVVVDEDEAGGFWFEG